MNLQRYYSMDINKIFNVIVTVALCAMLAVVAYILFYNDPDQPVLSPSAREKELRDSISLLQKQADESRLRQSRLQASYDSLLCVEPKIIYQTREKIKFIYTEATPHQLDSIIRAKSKRRKRYH